MVREKQSVHRVRMTEGIQYPEHREYSGCSERSS